MEIRPYIKPLPPGVWPRSNPHTKTVTGRAPPGGTMGARRHRRQQDPGERRRRWEGSLGGRRLVRKRKGLRERAADVGSVGVKGRPPARRRASEGRGEHGPALGSISARL